MGKSDIETFYEELANFKKRLRKDNKERCADSAVTERKQSALKCLVKNYNEKIRLGATTLDLRLFDEKIRFVIKDRADILRNRQQCTASAPGIDLSTFIPSANSTELSSSFTRRRSLGRSPSSSSATSEEDPLEITIIPAESKNLLSKDTEIAIVGLLRNEVIQEKPTPLQRRHNQEPSTEEPNGTIIMASANTTTGEALRQVIDPATPKFIQPPIFRPAVDSPSSFLLGYERAAIGNGWTDKYKILYLGQFLEGPAHKWYQEYLGNEENNENNWSTIKKDFKTEFMEGQQHEMASSNFYRKKQGYTKDIKQYCHDSKTIS
ncbi:hypothetical protein ABEB36_010673 [Hypothenemus hampei]|uniref:Retrotransposon gag domain-containing protein n=1 Tax=Hypothenemus hampei TaxID=57062 RepID=A0ABD1EDF3_HYPHA